MELVAMVLAAAIVVAALVSAAVNGVVAPIFLWNVAHVVGLTIPFCLYYFDISVVDLDFVDLNRSGGEVIARLTIYCATAVLATNAIACILSLYGPSMRHGLGTIPQRLLPPQDTMLPICVWAACLCIGAIFLIQAFGSLGAALALLSTKAYTPLAGQTYVLLPFTLAQLVAIVLGIEIATNPDVRPRRMLIAATVIAITMLIMLATGSRSKSLQTLLIPALAFLAKRKIGPKILIGVVAPMLVAVISWAGLELRGEYDEASNRGFDLLGAVTAFTTSYAILDQLVIVDWYVSAHDTNVFRFISDYSSLFVPRAFWPDKPQPPHLELRWFLFRDTQGGITPGFYGEFYYYFGSVGFAIGAIVSGVMLAVLGKKMLRSVREGRADPLIFVWTFVVGLQAPRDSLFVASFGLIVNTIFIFVLQRARISEGHLALFTLSNVSRPEDRSMRKASL